MNCLKCGFGMYCLRSDRIILGDKKRVKKGKNKRSERPLITESRERQYVCPNCDRRYMSVEILIPEPYMRKPLPKSKLKDLEKELIKR